MRDRLTAIMDTASDRARQSRPSDLTRKAHQDYVTDIDLALDDFLSAELAGLTPGIPVLSEERQIDGLPASYWMVDPIDGTANLIAGIPFVGIAAILVADGIPTLAAVADIHHAQVFSAEAGKGAFVGGTPLTQPETPTELIGVSSGVLARADIAALRAFGKLRNFGSQALQLCMVASGQLGASISYEAKLWDDAAGALIAAEAGACYQSNPTGPAAQSDQRSFCCHPDHLAALSAMTDALWETTP